MGNQSSAQYQVTAPLSSSWRQVSMPAHLADNLNFILLKNLDTKQQAQQYILSLPHSNLQEQLRKYNLRHLQNLHLVSIKHVQVLEGDNTCSVTKNSLRVIVERISHDLSMSPKLHQQQAKAVLLKVLIGFKAIFEFEGYIPVSSKLIFWNQFGEMKVWMNEDLPVNYPEQKGSFGLKGNGSEAQMVSEIIGVVENHVMNLKEFGMLKKLIIADGVLGFDRAIEVLSSRVMKERGVSPISLLSGSGVSPRTEEVIKAIESQGLKVVRTGEAKRYVEEPGRMIYREVEQQQQKPVLNVPSILNVHKISQGKQVKNVQQVKFVDFISSVQVRTNQSPARLFSDKSIRSPPARMIASSPQKIQPSTLMYRENKVITPVRQRISQQPPIQNIQRTTPIKTHHQPIHQSHIIHRSPSPRNSVTTIHQSVITSASPYFKQQPSYIVHLPIIRINNNVLDQSKISRVSVNSNKMSSRSRSRIQAPRIIVSKIQGKQEQYYTPNQLYQSQQLINQPSGFIQDSAVQSNVRSTGRKEPSIQKNLSIFQQTPPLIQKDEIIQAITTPQQPTIKQNAVTTPATSSKVQWIKISGKSQTTFTSNHESKASYSKVPTQVPNSPVTPRDIMVSYEQQSGQLNGNQFSIADLMPKYPKNQYGVQVNTISSLQHSNPGSQLNTSKDSSSTRKKMVIYTDVATIHCDDAIIEKGNMSYRITGEEQNNNNGIGNHLSEGEIEELR